jgi:hypothetical protein
MCKRTLYASCDASVLEAGKCFASLTDGLTTYIRRRPLFEVVLITLPIFLVVLEIDLARSGRNAAVTKYIDVALVRKAIGALVQEDELLSSRKVNRAG